MTRLRPLLRLLLALIVSAAFAAAQNPVGTPDPATPGHAHEHHDAAHDHDADHDHDAAHDHDADHAHDHAAGAPHATDHAHAAGLAGTRLLVASLDAPDLVVLDAATGATLGRFTVPGLGRAYQLPDPRLAAVVHRDANRVSIVHGGLSAVDHGDHADLLEGSPYVLATLNLGPLPTHLATVDHHLLVYLDGDGSMAWLDARLLGVTLDFVQIPGLGPDHGALTVLHDHLVGGGLAEGGVRVYDRDGTEIARFGDCPGLHGQAARGDAVAFGCADGVLLIDAPAGAFRARKIAHPAPTPEGTRVGSVVAHPASPMLIGNFGSGIALIDPVAATLTPVMLPDRPVAMAFADDGATLLVLTADGNLHALDPADGHVHGSLPVTTGLAEGAARPTLTVLGEHAFVADPAAGAVVTIDLHDLAITATTALGFRPGSVAALAIPGAARH